MGKTAKRPNRGFNAMEFYGVKPWIYKAVMIEESEKQKSLWKNEPDLEEASRRRKRQIKRLKKGGIEVESPLQRLEACAEERRCLSGACPECGRFFQRAFVKATRRNVCDSWSGFDGDLVAVSIVPNNTVLPRGRLATFDEKNFTRRLKSALKRCGIDRCVGAIDFSFNEDADDRFEAHWCPHVYLITVLQDRKAVKKELKRVFQTDWNAVRKPVKIQDFESTHQRISYAFKMYFDRRVSYRDKKGRRNTSKKRLLRTEQIELACLLNWIGFVGRLILLGVKPRDVEGQVQFKS